MSADVHDDDDDVIVEVPRPLTTLIVFSLIGGGAGFYLAVYEFHNLFARLLAVVFGFAAAIAPFFYGLKEIRVGKTRVAVDYGLYERVIEYKDLGLIQVYYATDLNNTSQYSSTEDIQTIRITSRRGLDIVICDQRVDADNLKADIEERATEMVRR